MTVVNISHIFANLGENQADFIEALANASHYLGVALDLLDRNDQVSIPLMEAEQTIGQVLIACEEHSEKEYWEVYEATKRMMHGGDDYWA